jgi:hypothetical protein
MVSTPVSILEAASVETVDVRRLQRQDTIRRHPFGELAKDSSRAIDVLDYVEHGDQVDGPWRYRVTILDALTHYGKSALLKRSDHFLIQLQTVVHPAWNTSPLHNSQKTTVPATHIEVATGGARKVTQDGSHLQAIKQLFASDSDRVDLLFVVVCVVGLRVDNWERGNGRPRVEPHMRALVTSYEPPRIPTRQQLIVESDSVLSESSIIANRTSVDRLHFDLRDRRVVDFPRRNSSLPRFHGFLDGAARHDPPLPMSLTGCR